LGGGAFGHGADRLGLDDRVELLGRVSDEDLPLWHKAADLFVLPSVAYEGFGLVTAEALASGTPVVGTPIGATPELLEPLDSRLLARGIDPATLAAAIRTGLRITTPAFRARCRDYALACFAWDTVISDWSRILEDAAVPHRRARDLMEAGHARAAYDAPRVRP
jgi:glycosyltransferase involved in cell wall biosynthesis